MLDSFAKQIPAITGDAPRIGLSFLIGKWFPTDYSATVGRILVTFTADPYEILIPLKCWKNPPSSVGKILTLLGRGGGSMNLVHDLESIFSKKLLSFFSYCITNRIRNF